MDTDCLRHRLTDDERRRFDEEGYLILPGLLGAERVSALTEAADRDTLALPPGRVGQPEGAVPVLAGPGDAVLFDRRLWHAASPNGSGVARKVLFYGYGYRWLRTKDEMTVRGLWEGSDPIRRQLLGWGASCNGFYSPTDDDVPLRVWLREHSPEEAI